MHVINLASRRRAEQYTRKCIAEHNVRLCEEKLRELREELVDAGRNLQEIEMSIHTLHDLIRRAPSNIGASGSRHANALLYHSDGSGTSDCSEDESLGSERST